MGVLGKVEGVIGAAERALEVAQEGVDRLELGQLRARLAAAGDHALVRGPDTPPVALAWDLPPGLAFDERELQRIAKQWQTRIQS